MTVDQFCSDINELLEQGSSATADDKITEMPGWCSLSFMGLLAMVDDRYEVALPPKAVLDSPSIAELFATIMQLRNAVSKAA